MFVIHDLTPITDMWGNVQINQFIWVEASLYLPLQLPLLDAPSGCIQCCRCGADALYGNSSILQFCGGAGSSCNLHIPNIPLYNTVIIHVLSALQYEYGEYKAPVGQCSYCEAWHTCRIAVLVLVQVQYITCTLRVYGDIGIYRYTSTVQVIGLLVR